MLWCWCQPVIRSGIHDHWLKCRGGNTWKRNHWVVHIGCMWSHKKNKSGSLLCSRSPHQTLLPAAILHAEQWGKSVLWSKENPTHTPWWGDTRIPPSTQQFADDVNKEFSGCPAKCCRTVLRRVQLFGNHTSTPINSGHNKFESHRISERARPVALEIGTYQHALGTVFGCCSMEDKLKWSSSKGNYPWETTLYSLSAV